MGSVQDYQRAHGGLVANPLATQQPVTPQRLSA